MYVILRKGLYILRAHMRIPDRYHQMLYDMISYLEKKGHLIEHLNCFPDSDFVDRFSVIWFENLVSF